MMIASPVNAFASGMEFGARGNEIKRQKEIADLYRAQGADLVAGKEGAVNALAALDPQQAYAFGRQPVLDRQQDQMFGMDMQTAEARLAELRAQGRREAETHALRMTAAQRQEEARQINGALAAGTAAWRAGPEAFTQWRDANAEALASANLPPEAVTHDAFPMIAAGFLGVSEGLMAGIQIGEALRPQAPQPQSSLGKIQADINSGLLPGDTPLRAGEPSRVIMGPDGNPVYMEGAAAGNFKFTEGQSKDNVYATRARGALEVLEPVASNLSSVGNRAAGAVPFGLGRGMQSDDYQVAEQAGLEFLQAILRKDTGAAITQDETESYGRTYLPQIGDSAAVLEAKRQARIRAVNALEAGMSPQQMLVRDRALIKAAEEAGTAPKDASGANPFMGMSEADFTRIDISKLSPEEVDQLFEAMGQ